MKLLTFILLISFSITSFYFQKLGSESKREIKFRNSVWADTVNFSNRAIPEKWKNESAVILNQKKTFTYSKRTASLIDEEITRRRIKLLDLAAVERFSEFYFYKLKASVTATIAVNGVPPRIEAGVKIIKPDGTEFIVDLKDAIDVGEIPKHHNPFKFQIDAHYKKVAIPNLEIGDVIDYFYYLKTPKYFDSGNFIMAIIDHSFDSHYIFLENDYPTYHQSIEINLKQNSNSFYLNYMSMNGAPQLVLAEKLINEKTGKVINEKHFRYILNDSAHRERKDDIYFSSFYNSNPFFKFQVYYISSNNIEKTECFVGEKKVSNSTPPLNLEVQKKISTKVVHSSGASPFANKVIRRIKKSYKNASIEEKIKEAYYLLRYYYLFDYNPLKIYFTEVNVQNKISQNIKQKEIENEFFCEIMRRVLEGLKIKYDLGVAMPKYLGEFESLLFDSELETHIIAYDELKAPIHLFPFTVNSDYNSIKTDFLGTKTLVFPKELYSKVDLTRFDSLSAANYSDNIRLIAYELEVDNTLNYVNVHKETSSSGAFKAIASNTVLYEEDYRYLQMKKYTPSEYEKLKETELSILKENKEIIRKERLKLYKEELEIEGFDVQEYKSFEITELGMDNSEQPFIYQEAFELNNFVTKAGNNYFLHAGKLIRNQVKIAESEKNNREIDIYIDFPKIYKNNIKIKIPKGYTAKNLEAFNILMNNEAGSFESSATVENNILIIKTTKTYKASHLPKESWINLVEMLDAAYSLSQQKIILKPF